MDEAKKIFQDILNKYPDDEYAMTSLNSLFWKSIWYFLVIFPFLNCKSTLFHYL
jgi:hypothetical protein